MENAGRGVADVLCRLGIAGPTVVCCGKGNNAGDGLRCRPASRPRGHPVRVLLWADPAELTGDAAANYRILSKTDVPIEVFCTRQNETTEVGQTFLSASEAPGRQCLPTCHHRSGDKQGTVPIFASAKMGCPLTARLSKLLDSAAWIVDALLGTGTGRASPAAGTK